MFSTRFFALACAATVWIGISAAWQQHPLTETELRDMGYDPTFEGPLPYVGDPYASPSIYILNIDFTSERAAKETHLYLKYLNGSDPNNSQNSRDHIREVHVKGWSGMGDLSLVETIFRKLEYLDRVYWEYPGGIPASIVQSIEKNNPSCQLYYMFRQLNSDGHGKGKGQAWRFIHSPSLYSIKADISYGHEDNLHDIGFVFRILSTAPNLKEVDVYLHHEGCVVGGVNAYAFDFESHPSARFPPLEVLRLDGYNLDERADGGYEWYFKGLGWRWRSTKGKKGNLRTSFDAWKQAMDWSHLHTLYISWPSKNTLNTLKYDMELPALRNLTIIGGPRDTIEEEAISLVTKTASQLEALSLGGFEVGFGSTVINWLSTNPAAVSKLKSFSFGAGGINTLFLPQENITKLISTSPKLEKLDLNVPRSAALSTEHEPFKSFASSPTLNHLTLRFPSPDEGAHEMPDESTPEFDFSSMDEPSAERNIRTSKRGAPDPLVNKRTALELFKALRAAKNGEKLKRLDLVVGDWDFRFEVYFGLGTRMRVAFWRCWFEYGTGEICEGEQTRMAV